MDHMCKCPEMVDEGRNETIRLLNVLLCVAGDIKNKNAINHIRSLSEDSNMLNKGTFSCATACDRKVEFGFSISILYFSV